MASDIDVMGWEEMEGHIMAETKKLGPEWMLKYGGDRTERHLSSLGWNDEELRPTQEKSDARRRCKALGDKEEADRVSTLRPSGLAALHMT